MIDLILLAIVGLVTWMVANEGAWGAVLTFFCVVFAGLIAMNFFEPVGAYLDQNLAIAQLRNQFDFIALVGIFALFVFLLRLATDHIAPTTVEIHTLGYEIVRWLFGFLTGYVTMAILCTSLHTAALPRNFAGFTPERPNFLGATYPDRQWLAFTQHVSEFVFPRWQQQRDETNQIVAVKRIFDGMLYTLPGKQPPNNRIQLPTFIMRYATRRELVAGGGLPVTPGGSGIRPTAPTTGGSTATSGF